MNLVSPDLLSMIRQCAPELPPRIVALHLSLVDPATGEFNLIVYPLPPRESLDSIGETVRQMSARVCAGALNA